jgi:uncharacterized protein YfaT (DUF1175 family)
MENNNVDYNIKNYIIQEKELKNNYEKELKELDSWFTIEKRVIETQIQNLLIILKERTKKLFDEKKQKEKDINKEYLSNKKAIEQNIKYLVESKINDEYPGDIISFVPKFI